MNALDRKWDFRYLEMAYMVASWSKDPSTKTGAVFVDNQRRLISVGYNGFAQPVEDHPERYADRYGTKYKIVIHCEENALIFAERARLVDSCLYTVPFMSCGRCAAKMIQAGVKRIVAPAAEHIDRTKADDPNRWERDFVLAEMQFQEAGVEMVFYPQAELEALKNKYAQPGPTTGSEGSKACSGDCC